MLLEIDPGEGGGNNLWAANVVTSNECRGAPNCADPGPYRHENNLPDLEKDALTQGPI